MSDNRFKQRMVLRHFGPIDQVELNVEDVMLFIGGSASGKSTIVKAAYFFKSIRHDIVRYYVEAIDTNSLSDSPNAYGSKMKDRFVEYFGLSFDKDERLYIEYRYSETTHIKVTLGEGKKLGVTFSNAFVQKMKGMTAQAKEVAKTKADLSGKVANSRSLKAAEEAKRSFTAQLEHTLDDLFNDDRELLFIPAGRSILATLSDQIGQISLERLDFLTGAFVDHINTIRPLFIRSLEDMRASADGATDFIDSAISLLDRILKGRYERSSAGEHIAFDGGTVQLKFASSGQQESLWVLLALFIVVLEQQKWFVVIEEPESHLFPEAQRDMVHLLALVANAHPNGSQVLVTTHSPYIVAVFNNLMLAHRSGQSAKVEVEKVISEPFWLDGASLSAHQVKDGGITSIIDQEFGLIDTAYIDSISSKINSDFDSLYELDGQEA